LACFLKSEGGKTDENAENFGHFPLLKKDLQSGEAVIWYLGHAGWAVKTKKTLLIFDYWERGRSDQPSLANGHINPEEVKDLDVYVFISHVYDDHYDEIIFDLENTIDRLTYVFGFSLETAEPRVFFPMHSQSREFLFRELADKLTGFGYPATIIAPENRGDAYIYQNRKIKYQVFQLLMPDYFY
jgi:hypothetical protein